MSLKLRLLRVWALMLMLTVTSFCEMSCTVGPDFVRPEPPVTTDFRSDPKDSGAEPVPDALTQRFLVGQAVTSEWWTLFQSAELNTLVAQAIEGNRTL
jgi:outer membrane protein TolC